MLRLGAHKQRLTRSEYNARKQSAKIEVDLRKEIEKKQLSIDKKINELKKEDTILKRRIAKIKEEGALLLIKLSSQERRPRLFYMKKVNKLKEDIREYKSLYMKFRKRYLRLKNSYNNLLSESKKLSQEHNELQRKYNENRAYLHKLRRGEVTLKLTPRDSYDVE
ncbi:hypothetical protein [Vibrio diabolicus]